MKSNSPHPSQDASAAMSPQRKAAATPFIALLPLFIAVIAAQHRREAVGAPPRETLNTTQGIMLVVFMLVVGIVVGSGIALIIKYRGARTQ